MAAPVNEGPFVELRIWGVDHVPAALARVPLTRRRLRNSPGLTFAKTMGTGSARTFTPRDADLHHWALLTVWDTAVSAEDAAAAAAMRSWDLMATEQLRVTMRPIASRGRWSRREPFGALPARDDGTWSGPVAAVTRARLRPTRAMSFWRAVPPVVGELSRADGLRLALGIGEAPIGLQGTFSVWGSSSDLAGFAYRSPEHLDAARRTEPARWYAEELFTRLAVLDISGTYDGRNPMSPFAIRARTPVPARATSRAHPVNRSLLTAAWILVAAGVVAQIAFPYTDGGNLVLTVASVAFFAAAVTLDLASMRGARAVAAVLIVAGGGGLVAESVGVHTGFPFGSYDYTGTLGAEVLDVPVVVPFAWITMAWPALAAARRLTGPGRRWVTAVVGAYALTAWDVFLDPQMVDQGYWRWHDPEPALPGVDGIPLTNVAGWLLVSFLMIATLDRLIDKRALDALPIAIYLWTYVSSVIAHALFFGRPPVALVGGMIMGLVAIPLIVVLARGRKGDRQHADQ